MRPDCPSLRPRPARGAQPRRARHLPHGHRPAVAGSRFSASSFTIGARVGGHRRPNPRCASRYGGPSRWQSPRRSAKPSARSSDRGPRPSPPGPQRAILATGDPRAGHARSPGPDRRVPVSVDTTRLQPDDGGATWRSRGDGVQTVRYSLPPTRERRRTRVPFTAANDKEVRHAQRRLE